MKQVDASSTNKSSYSVTNLYARISFKICISSLKKKKKKTYIAMKVGHSYENLG